LALRRILERAGRDTPAADAAKLVGKIPARLCSLIAVAGPRAGELEGALGVIERDARGTSLRSAGRDPVAPGVPGFACTNHFRVRSRPVDCRRYAAIARRLRGLSDERRALDFETAFGIMHDVRQTITMQTFVANLRTRAFSLKLMTPENARSLEKAVIDFTWEEVAGGDRPTRGDRP
ncbi:MAG: hypothetical protein ACYTFI_21525, partial [Planctomycetota bacterium]